MPAIAFRADTIQLGANVQFIHGAADPTGGGGPTGGPYAVNSFYWQDATLILWQKTGTANTAWTPLVPLALFGDGSDGTVNIGAGTTTLARDMYYDNLTIPNTGILVPRGFRIFVRNTLTIDVGGSLLMDGGNAAGAVAGIGSPAAAGSIGAAGAAGGAGAVAAGANGGASASGIQGFTGAGGAGGLGSAGAGGAGGVLTIQAANSQGNPRSLVQASIASQVGGAATARLTSGSGGGGGGGDAVNSGGGGGGGGGEVHVIARVVVNNGTIRAAGGNGAAGVAGNAGGGGGGGGGLVVIGTHSYTGNVPTAPAGAAGAGVGTGVAGTAGGVGVVVQLQA